MSEVPPGFVRRKRKDPPPPPEKEFYAMFRRKGQDPFIDWNRTYTADQLVWTDDGGSWCVVAVKEAD